MALQILGSRGIPILGLGFLGCCAFSQGKEGAWGLMGSCRVFGGEGSFLLTFPLARSGPHDTWLNL